LGIQEGSDSHVKMNSAFKVDYRDIVKLGTDIFNEGLAQGLKPRMALEMASNKVAPGDVKVRNTLLSKFVGEQIHFGLTEGHSIEFSVRDALKHFDIGNEETVKKLIAMHDKEFNRIHGKVKANELIGVGRAIQLVDGNGEAVMRSDLQSAKVEKS
jgi:hypothetical protein